MANIKEIYLDQERYNPRIRATVPAAWIAVFTNGNECAICRGYEAKNAEEARAIYDVRD